MVKIGGQKPRPNTLVSAASVRGRTLGDKVYRGISRDVTRSRACLVTPLIRHFGGQASAVVCAVCAVQCVVYTSYQPACGVVYLWMLLKDKIFKHVFHEISRQDYN